MGTTRREWLKSLNGKAPFNPETGELIHRPVERHEPDNPNAYKYDMYTIGPNRYSWIKADMRDAYTFSATLKYDGCTGKGNAQRKVEVFKFKDQNGRTWPMGAREFDQVVPKLSRGKISGTWEIIKRWEYYTIKLVEA